MASLPMSAELSSMSILASSKPYNPSAAFDKILADSTAKHAPLDIADHGSKLNQTNPGLDYQSSPGSQSTTGASAEGSEDTSQPTTQRDRDNARNFGLY
nr:uncharacterized protein I203_05534 [Kwoniella mangroviensis CBS 8507]OCF65288.1 hypothetical protein I203_05534 [Kwoniella mangroviensis CBS 8507]